MYRKWREAFFSDRLLLNFVFVATANQYNSHLRHIAFLLTCLRCINSEPLFENYVLCSHSVMVVGLMSICQLHLVCCLKSHCVCNISVSLRRPLCCFTSQWRTTDSLNRKVLHFRCFSICAQVCSHLTNMDEAASKCCTLDALASVHMCAHTWLMWMRLLQSLADKNLSP